MKRQALIYTSLVLLTFILTGIFFEPVAAKDETYRYLSNFADTLELIRRNYVDDVPLEPIIDGAYRGLLEELDPESFYLSPTALKTYGVPPQKGENGVLGLDLSKRHGYASVVSVMPGSPADGKLSSGDYVRGIDGRSTREMSLYEVRQRIRGTVGSTLKLKVVRRGSYETEVIELERAEAKSTGVEKLDLDDGLLGLKLVNIDAGTVERVAETIRAKSDATGLVLDLRGCSLGQIAASSALTNLFVDSGAILRVQGRTNEPAVKEQLSGLDAAREKTDADQDGYTYRVTATSETTVFRGDLIVLVDSGTAGPAEATVAALRDSGRATILGHRTFGRASLQDLIPLEDGAAVLLTVARVISLDGDSLLGTGVDPDEEIDTDTDDGDPVLERAIERLKSDGGKKKAA